jgi:hypothetical protein
MMTFHDVLCFVSAGADIAILSTLQHNMTALDMAEKHCCLRLAVCNLQSCTGKSSNSVDSASLTPKHEVIACGLGTWRLPGWVWSASSMRPADDRVHHLQNAESHAGISWPWIPSAQQQQQQSCVSLRLAQTPHCRH